MKSKGLIAAIVSTLSILCSCSHKKEPICKLTHVETIETSVASNYKGVKSYIHYILVKDFSKRCLDSTEMVNLALKYIDTVKELKPVDVTKFYFSNKDFVHGESQEMSKIEKSCLFSITFKNNKIELFTFYNNSGDEIYNGSKWRPEGSSIWYD